MKIFHILLLTIFIIVGHYSITIGQSQESEIENTQISILTCRSGDELYSTFGHTAIRIFNPDSNLDYVYNYGIFSFNTPNFYIKFMRGQLPYFLGGTKMEYFLREYDFEHRSVLEQKLILDSNQKGKIIEFLINNAKPENKYYDYDFFHDNCATRVVDVFSLAGQVSYANEIEQKSFRDLLKENLKNLVWSDFGIDIVIGSRADVLTSRRNQMFLPEYVMSNLKSAKLNDTANLAKPAQLILDYEGLDAKRKSKTTNWPLICTTLLLIITLIINFIYPQRANLHNKVILLISGILGLFLLFMWFGTNHGATRDNWNLLWLNPILLFYVLSKDRLKKVLAICLICLLVVAAVNCLYTVLPQFFNLAFLPLILSIIAIVSKELDDQRRKTKFA